MCCEIKHKKRLVVMTSLFFYFDTNNKVASITTVSLNCSTTKYLLKLFSFLISCDKYRNEFFNFKNYFHVILDLSTNLFLSIFVKFQAVLMKVKFSFNTAVFFITAKKALILKNECFFTFWMSFNFF
jgi:ABC-type maltose transport system permease subunit